MKLEGRDMSKLVAKDFFKQLRVVAQHPCIQTHGAGSRHAAPQGALHPLAETDGNTVLQARRSPELRPAPHFRVQESSLIKKHVQPVPHGACGLAPSTDVGLDLYSFAVLCQPLGWRREKFTFRSNDRPLRDALPEPPQMEPRLSVTF